MAAELTSATSRARAGQEISFSLVNRGPGRVGFGHAFRLERKADRGWVDVRFGPRNMAWPAILLTLPPGRRFEQSVEIPQYARPGRYRVIKRLEWDEPAVCFELDVIPSGWRRWLKLSV